MEEQRTHRKTGFLEYLYVMVRRWKLVLSIFAVVFVVGVVMSLFSSKVYKATSTIKLAIKSPALAVLPEYIPTMKYYDPVLSQIEVVKSRRVGEIAVSLLGLNFFILDNPDSLLIDSVALSPDAPLGVYTLSVKKRTVNITNKNGAEISSGHIGRFFKENGIGLRVKSPSTIDGKVSFEILAPYPFVGSISSRVSIKQIPRTNLASITASSRDPRNAARLANAWAEAYVKYTLYDVRSEATQNRIFLENQLAIVEKNLRDAEKRLEDFKEKTGVIILNVSTTTLVNRIATVEREKADAETDLRENEMKLSSIKSQLAGSAGSYGKYKKLATSPDVSSNSLVSDLRRQLANLETEKARLLEKYTENHPDVQEVEQQIDQVKKEMASVVSKALAETPAASDPVFQSLFEDLISTETKVNSLRARIDGLNRVLSEENSQLESLPSTERELAELQREVETNRSVHSLLSNKLEEARIAEATTVPEAKIIDQAEVPIAPSNAGILRKLILAILLGIVLGITGAYTMEAIRTTVDTPEEAEEMLGSPVLAVIPRIRSTIRPDFTGVKKFLLTNLRPRHPAREAYRVLRTNLLLHREKAHQVKTIMITSSQPEEGKSLTAANLALTCALMGDHVLLIDADPRKPVLHEVFDVPNEIGFIDAVQGRSALNINTIPEIPNLGFVSAGKITGEYEVSMRPEGIDRVLSEVRDKYDLVILDNSPITVGADPIELGSKVDGIILVIRSEKTSSAMLYRVKEIIQRTNLPILGSVFNAMRPSSEYYYSYTRYYGYGYTEEKKGFFLFRVLKRVFGRGKRKIDKRS